jgi:poly(hydroxyalkanoate) depolymerase family esterase
MNSRAAAGPSLGLGSWVAGLTSGPCGVRRYYLCAPPELMSQEGALPLVVMLHGCGQTALDFARSTRMNLLAARERFFVLYLEQDKLSNPKGCWNWHERCSGIADAEAATVMNAIDDVCRRYRIDRDRIAVAGLSAGASMAALVATRYPQRFMAVAMHSGVAPSAAMTGLTALAAMRGQHFPPIVLTAVGKAVGAAAVGATLPPLMVLHGDSDDVVVPTNADCSAAIWAMASRAHAGAERTWKRGKRHAVSETEFTRAGRTFAKLCKVSGLGHAWSGGTPGLPYSDADGPCATRMFWDFAKGQFVRPIPS